ncbi:hypothetical protein [Paraburkholderia megapolitana]|uniref:hypothetical protein n=1 Tax=Paraburkholderia megapolitana TaxID=420953 RepID=UPI0038BB93CC
MKQSRIAWMVALALTAGIAACGSRDGSEFVGTWKQIHESDPDAIVQRGSALVIERRDDQGFVVTLCRHLDAANRCPPQASGHYPATLVNGVLQVHTGAGEMDAGYDPKSKHILFGGDENVRVEPK